MSVQRSWTNELRFEGRTLHIEGDIRVTVANLTGHDSGWHQIRAGLLALGFQVTTALTEASKLDGATVPTKVVR